MNWKFWKPEPAATPEPALSGQSQYIANFLADRENKDKTKRLLIELVEQTRFLTQQDIGKWRSAWQKAISVEYPNRIELLAVYRDIEIDGHLTGVVGQIVNEVLQRKYHIVNRETGDPLPDLEKQLEDAQWFIDFCTMVVVTPFFGYSLIQFGDTYVDDNGVTKFCEVEVVDREYVIPEHNVFVRQMGDHYTNGIDYTKPPYSQWVIGVGRRKDLGLYNKVAKEALAKKNMLAFWDKFGQIFGSPMRIGKTSSTNPADRNNISSMLQNMGNAAWGIFPDGTDIEIKETTRGDAYQVYDKRIDRANGEMSKAIVNQTMTSDNGSSKSQGEVHLVIGEKVFNYFATMLRIVINDKLLPFMRMHGFKGWEQARFIHDDSITYSVQEQINIETMLLNSFEVESQYFIDKYNVPVQNRKQAPPPPEPGADDPKNKGFFD